MFIRVPTSPSPPVRLVQSAAYTEGKGEGQMKVKSRARYAGECPCPALLLGPNHACASAASSVQQGVQVLADGKLMKTDSTYPLRILHRQLSPEPRAALGGAGCGPSLSSRR